MVLFSDEKYKTSPFRNVIEVIFKLELKYKDEVSDNKQKLVKLLTNSSYGENFRQDITEEYECKSGFWLSTEYDEIVLD